MASNPCVLAAMAATKRLVRCDGTRVRPCDGPLRHAMVPRTRRATLRPSHLRAGPSHLRTGPSHLRTGPSPPRTVAPSHRTFPRLSLARSDATRPHWRDAFLSGDDHCRPPSCGIGVPVRLASPPYGLADRCAGVARDVWPVGATVGLACGRIAVGGARSRVAHGAHDSASTLDERGGSFDLDGRAGCSNAERPAAAGGLNHPFMG